MPSVLLGAHSCDPEAELDSVSCDEHRPGQRHDVDAFGIGNGNTLDLWAGDSLGDCRGKLGNGINSSSSSSIGDEDGFGGGGYNRRLSDDDEPPRSWWVLLLCIRSRNDHVVKGGNAHKLNSPGETASSLN
jgi:hypothetical protein